MVNILQYSKKVYSSPLQEEETAKPLDTKNEREEKEEPSLDKEYIEKILKTTLNDIKNVEESLSSTINNSLNELKNEMAEKVEAINIQHKSLQSSNLGDSTQKKKSGWFGKVLLVLIHHSIVIAGIFYYNQYISDKNMKKEYENIPNISVGSKDQVKKLVSEEGKEVLIINKELLLYYQKQIDDLKNSLETQAPLKDKEN